MTALPNNSQFKCYDGMHNWNQLQPAPYDGMYSVPERYRLNPTTGKPAGSGGVNGKAGTIVGSNCTICVANPDTTDPYPLRHRDAARRQVRGGSGRASGL